MASNTKPLSPSLFKSKSIFLNEWWLVKPQRQRKGLAVGGVASMERERVFLSTVIAKRHEANVLETEDGITIIFRGFINTSRTSQNGFPSEVCRQFLLGFPHDWKNYSAHSSGDESIDGVTGFDYSKSDASSHKTADETLPFSVPDNTGFTKRKDFLLSNNEVSDYCTPPKKNCNGLGNSFRNGSKQSESTDNMECSIDKMTVEAGGKDNMASLKLSQPQVDMIYNGEKGVSDVAAVESQNGNPGSGQSLMGMFDPKTGVSTMKLKKDQLSSDRKEKKRTRQKIVFVEDPCNSCSRVVTRSIYKRSHTMLKNDGKVTVTCVSSPVRRSPRLYNCKQ